MIRFLLGVAAGSLIRSNPRVVSRGLARLLIKTEEATTFVSQQASRLSAQFSEDYEDLVAESRNGRDSSKNGDL